MKKKTSFVFLGLISMLFALLFAQSRIAHAAKKTWIKFATVAPEGSTWMKQMRNLDQTLEKKSHGEIGFRIYAGGIAGDELDVLRKIRIGQIHCAAFSSEAITFTVLVDKDFQGPITNTATITHSTLKQDKVVSAVAYITDQPVLKISKSASPNPVKINGELLYTLKLNNLGQQATNLVVTDTLPLNVQYVPGSASSSGQLVGNQIRWEFPVLSPLEERTFTFRVKVLRGLQIENNRYRASCAEGVSAWGDPVITDVLRPNPIFLPFISQ